VPAVLTAPAAHPAAGAPRTGRSRLEPDTARGPHLTAPDPAGLLGIPAARGELDLPPAGAAVAALADRTGPGLPAPRRPIQCRRRHRPTRTAVANRAPAGRTGRPDRSFRAPRTGPPGRTCRTPRPRRDPARTDGQACSVPAGTQLARAPGTRPARSADPHRARTQPDPPGRPAAARAADPAARAADPAAQAADPAARAADPAELPRGPDRVRAGTDETGRRRRRRWARRTGRPDRTVR
jgi:hypothetical protein